MMFKIRFNIIFLPLSSYFHWVFRFIDWLCEDRWSSPSWIRSYAVCCVPLKGLLVPPAFRSLHVILPLWSGLYIFSIYIKGVHLFPNVCASCFSFPCLVCCDRLCGLVVRVLGYRSGGPGSIPGTTKKSSGSGTVYTQPREYNWGAAW
jgi:hypothetical protein